VSKTWNNFKTHFRHEFKEARESRVHARQAGYANVSEQANTNMWVKHIQEHTEALTNLAT